MGHEASLVIFLIAHLLVISAFLPFWYPVMYLSFVIGMGCLLQFAFAFPRPWPTPTLARWMGALSLFSIVLCILQAVSFWFSPQDQAAHRALRVEGVGLGLWQILAAMIVLAHQAARLDGSNRPVWLSLVAPIHPDARAARNMLLASLAIAGFVAATFAYPIWLSQILPVSIFNIAWSIGLMLMLSLFDITYLFNTPESISFQTRLVLGTLTSVLTSVWLLSLVYPFQLQVSYDSARLADIEMVRAELLRNKNTGADLLDTASLPPTVTFIAACPSEESPTPGELDLFFVRQTELDMSHLCEDKFLMGSLYGMGSLETLSEIQTLSHDGQNYLVGFAFADYLETMNSFSIPIALVLLGSTLIIMLLLPLVFYTNLVKPLGALLNGMQQVNRGRLDVIVPIQSNDEIGQLAQSFNAMAAELRTSVTTLENQFAESRKAEKSLREQQEQLRALSARFAEVEEAERSKLARELHDQAGQNLTALNLTLKLVRTQLTASAPSAATSPQIIARLDDASELVRQTTQLIRNVMEDLHPPALEEFGLTAALRWYTNRFTALTNIAVNVSGPDPLIYRLPQVEIALFRIAQEALTNIARHAQASRVDIQLNQTADSISMIIQDNGQGFDASKDVSGPVEPRSRWGLRIMAERAESIGGTWRVESVPRQGTRIIVEVKL